MSAAALNVLMKGTLKMQGKMLRYCVRVCAVYGVLWICFSAFAGRPADASIRIDVVECDAKDVLGERVDGVQLSDLYGRRHANAVFSAFFTLGGKREFREAERVLVPTGFLYSASVSCSPNPMNYSRSEIGTGVSIRYFGGDVVRFKLSREYVVGIKAAMKSTPETFVMPVFGRVDFDFEIPRRAGRSVVGGGWKEEAHDKVYYVVAVLSD